MIYDERERGSLYRGLWDSLDKAFDLLSRIDSIELKQGRNDIDENIYVMYLVYDTVGRGEGFYEYHKQYIDIQLLLKGEEHIRYTNLSDPGNMKPFDREGDVGICHIAEGIDLLLKPGNFALFLPGEYHMPKLAVNEPAPVEKVVIKVRVAE